MSRGDIEQHLYAGGAEKCCPEELYVTLQVLVSIPTNCGLLACKLVVIASRIGSKDLSGHIQTLRGVGSTNPQVPELRRIVCLDDTVIQDPGVELHFYNSFTANGHLTFQDDSLLKRAEADVHPGDVLNLQLTSGIYFQLSFCLCLLTPYHRHHRFPEGGHVDTQVGNNSAPGREMTNC
jgi:hypothetical protein